MRWKAFFYLNPSAKAEIEETYGFNSTRTPPYIPEMKHFEEKMETLIKNIKFRKHTNNFQSMLKNKIKNIVSDDKVLVKADKTSNFYKMNPDDYKEMLEKNIQTAYKKAPADVSDSINKEAYNIASTLKIADRVDKSATREAFLTMKDHKPNFTNKPSCRLINPAKSELGKASKRVLQRITSNIMNAEKLNLWRNTGEVITWFKEADKKPTAAFICFDIVDFYPSITDTLLEKALKFASEKTSITKHEIDLIYHTKKSLLFANDTTWVKSSQKTNFDVTMGSFDGAETCELIGLFLLHELQKEHGQQVGLYRDDGLAILNETPQEIERIKKKMCYIFKSHGLRITIEANKKIVNYLDVTLDLNQKTYKPFKKPNDTPMYVNTKSNHPPSVLRSIPKGINRRLSNLSATSEIFKESVQEYQKALKSSGHTHILRFNEHLGASNSNQTSKPEAAKRLESKECKRGQGESDEQVSSKTKCGEKDECESKPKRKRHRNIIWFNPPFERTVETNVGKEFLEILDESFPARNKLSKIFNRSSVKISYSCMPNLKQIIDGANKKKIKKKTSNNTAKASCNCRVRDECPLQQKCLSSAIVYQATVTEVKRNKKETYVGITETTFKQRYANHKQSFKQEKYKTQTELSKHIWALKHQNIEHQITWKILQHAQPCKPGHQHCNLCTSEKYYIICQPEMATLNTRAELISMCRHRRKHLLSSVT